MNKSRLLRSILAGSKNVDFESLKSLVEAFGFKLSRVSGSHHIFVHPEVRRLLNLQNVNGQAKPYQIRQFIKIIEEYGLNMGDQQ